MLFWYNLDFLNDKNQEEFQKEVKGSHREPKEVKNKGIHWHAKISQPKEPPCEKRLPLRNHFAAKRTMLQTKPPPTKSFRSHKPTSYEIFCSCETPLRCTRAISRLRNELRNPPKPNFTATSLPSEKFRSYETTPRHMCAISQPPKPISQLQNELWNTMWTPHLAAKWPSSCENPNHHLNTKLNL